MFIKSLLALYGPQFPRIVVYMLQSTEYQLGKYLRWLWSTGNFAKVMYRKSLVFTRATKLLLLTLVAGMAAQYIGSLVWATSLAANDQLSLIGYPLALFLMTPIIWAHLINLPVWLGRYLINYPIQAFQVRRSKSIFAKHQAVKIAVAGSYGKTTMKELLLVVLSEGMKVTATPANKNVSVSHAQFAKKLKGDEEVLVIEYGEGAPGDISRFVSNTGPDIGIITGLAPAHMDRYKTLRQAGEDIFFLADYLDNQNIYVNGESESIKPFLKPSHVIYNSSRVGEWRISDVKVGLRGLSFKLSHKKRVLNLRSQLLGRHQVGPLALAAFLAAKFGLSDEQIVRGVSKVRPFEHRMQAKKINGAWLLDDTYNGNIEGIKAGLQLLTELPGKRKIYVTPGLVDQGKQSAQIHHQLGRLIAVAKPDIVVLMKHSVTQDIESGLREGNFKGQLMIENDPLNFYHNLDQFMASGDVVLMQNDWPDNYK